ncbi:MAG: ABC transporter substrate-binding protein [Flavobacteriaceae bacterium]|nr:ABC transporter substrate-binding protein [Flavobacteriaceae bacterium]
MRVKDQLNRTLEFSTIPQRIVSLVPSHTELIVDLNLNDKLVGITKFCVHPEHLRKEKTVVGGTKNVHLEKIYALRPDVIICNKEENTPEMVEELGHIAPVWVSDIKNIEDSLEMTYCMGELFGKSDEAKWINEAVLEQKHSFETFIQDRPWKKMAYVIWKQPFMAAGSDTFINSLLEINKFDNVITENRYPQVDLHTLKEADIVLLSTEPFPFKEYDAQELERVLQTKVRLVDGEFFSWYGSRLIKAFSYFRSLEL